ATNSNTGQTIALTTAPGSGAQPGGAPGGGRKLWATLAATEATPPRMAPVYAQPLPGCSMRGIIDLPGSRRVATARYRQMWPDGDVRKEWWCACGRAGLPSAPG